MAKVKIQEKWFEAEFKADAFSRPRWQTTRQIDVTTYREDLESVANEIVFDAAVPYRPLSAYDASQLGFGENDHGFVYSVGNSRHGWIIVLSVL